MILALLRLFKLEYSLSIQGLASNREHWSVLNEFVDVILVLYKEMTC